MRILFLFSTLLLAAPAFADSSADEPLTPLPLKAPELNPQKVALGNRLFHDRKLSKDGTVSCSSCHDLRGAGGADGKVRSSGIGGALGDINAPTVLNSGFNFRQFWNGRARTLEDQVDGPVQHPKEMGSDWKDVVSKLGADREYLALFREIYGSGPNRENIKDAIATFERSLVTPNSPVDRYLRGDKGALNAKQLAGYQLFKSYGCTACHQGQNVGGNMFQTMGVMGNYFKDRGKEITDADLGRYAVTKEESDRHVFRVPSLRNVGLTAPYFHDGSAPTLERAVTLMARYQLGRTLPSKDLEAIIEFLKALTGEAPRGIASEAKK